MGSIRSCITEGLLKMLRFKLSLNCRQLWAGTCQCTDTSFGHISNGARCVYILYVLRFQQPLLDTAHGDTEVTRWMHDSSISHRGDLPGGCPGRLRAPCPTRRRLEPLTHSDPDVMPVAVIQPAEAYQPWLLEQIRANRKHLSTASTCPLSVL